MSLPRRVCFVASVCALAVASGAGVARAQQAPGQPAAGEPGAAAQEGAQGEELGAETPHAPSDFGAEGEAPAEEGAGEQAAAPPEAPVQPLAPEQQRRLQPAPGELSDREESGHSRFLLPPYMYEWGRGHHTRVVFPFYFESRVRDEFQLLIPPYYRLRTPRVQGDVVFPLYFGFRGTGDDGARWSTTVIPPVWVHGSRGPERAHGAAYGVAPLFSYAESFDRTGRLQSEHLVIPLLLTFHRWWPTGQTTIAGPVVYLRDRGTVDWAVVPFVFGHSSPQLSWRVIPPLFFYQRTNHEENRTFTWALLYFGESGPGSASHNVAPLFFHAHDRTASRTTFLPFFHTESGPGRFSLITPLGGYVRSGEESTLVLPLYQRHRGVTDWDGVLPLFYYGRTPRTGQTTLVAGPVFSSTGPSGYSWGVFPFVGRWHEYGRYSTIATPLFVHAGSEETRTSTTWVFPSFHARTAPDHRFFNFYPLVFTARGSDWHHNVVFPFVWDVGNARTGHQVTVVAPFYARVADRNSSIQWVFPNHFYWDAVRDGQRSFGWDFFPFVQYGEPRPGDMYWSVLHGLVGYRRQGSYSQWRVLYIPFGGAAPAATSAPSRQARGARPGDVLLEL